MPYVIEREVLDLPAVTAAIGNVTLKVAPPRELQEKTATENGVVLPDEGFDGLSKVTVNVSGGTGTLQPTLFAPSISLDGDVISIAQNAKNGAFATAYDIYDNGELAGSFSSLRIDISSLPPATGIRRHTVKAKGEYFNDSEASNEVIRAATLGDIMRSADGSTLKSSDGYKISVKKG